MTGELLKQPLPHDKKQGFSGTQVLGIVVGAMFIAIVATVFAIKIFFFSGPFTPVQLSPGEAQQLAEKIEKVEGFSKQAAPKKNEYAKDGTLLPKQYSEEGASRRISFTERELNAMIANNTELAEKLAVKLADNMVSIKLLIPLDPDLPMLGGKTLRVSAGAELAYREGRPVIKLKGISLMGVPIPNAWLGGIKNIDLIREFGANNGFWKTFADGVDSISVADGFLKVQLKE
jgi:hypothetical protein